MFRTTSVMALGLFLGLAPVGGLAQTQTDDTDTQTQLTEPATPETDTEQQLTEPATPETDTDQQLTEPATPETDTEQQLTEPATPETDTEQQLTEPATPETDEPEVATGEADQMTEEVIAVQEDGTLLATSLIGASVNLADESIGTVSNLIIGPDYELQGVVVGVGGFLGIGEKRVALPMERITIRSLEGDEVELTADTTREDLEEAEAFKTAAQVRAEQEAEQAEQMQQQQQPALVE